MKILKNFINYIGKIFKEQKNNNSEKHNENDNVILKLYISNILNIYEVGKMASDIEYIFSKYKLLPKEKFYKRYNLDTFYVLDKTEALNYLNDINFIFKGIDETLLNIYPNRKIYYILNEFDNLIKLKIIDNIFGINMFTKYEEILNQFLLNLKNMEINEIKNNNKINEKESAIKLKDIELKYSEIKKDIENFNIHLDKILNLNKNIHNELCFVNIIKKRSDKKNRQQNLKEIKRIFKYLKELDFDSNILENQDKKISEKEIENELNKNTLFKDYYSNLTIFEKIKEIKMIFSSMNDNSHNNIINMNYHH